jgi:hypothetical protein
MATARLDDIRLGIETQLCHVEEEVQREDVERSTAVLDTLVECASYLRRAISVLDETRVLTLADTLRS